MNTLRFQKISKFDAMAAAMQFVAVSGPQRPADSLERQLDL